MNQSETQPQDPQQKHPPRSTHRSREPTELSSAIDNLTTDFCNAVIVRKVGESIILSDLDSLQIIAVITVNEVRGQDKVKIACRVKRSTSTHGNQSVRIDRDAVYLGELNSRNLKQQNRK